MGISVVVKIHVQVQYRNTSSAADWTPDSTWIRLLLSLREAATAQGQRQRGESEFLPGEDSGALRGGSIQTTVQSERGRGGGGGRVHSATERLCFFGNQPKPPRQKTLFLA
ncbi:hypothetical protein Q8A73_018049 [Channa argus]|nr:hypothetical protein Q8A73_018049 [Channa argus]